MIEIKRDQTIDVTVGDEEREDSNILVSLCGSLNAAFALTPDQGRRLAMELIEAVHKVEVRRSLRRLHPAVEQDYPAGPAEAAGHGRLGKPFWVWGGSGSQN